MGTVAVASDTLKTDLAVFHARRVHPRPVSYSCFGDTGLRYTLGVTWLLFGVPGALMFVSALLALSSSLEQRVLSPRAMIVSAARARRSQPEFTEAFVAREVERLLRDVQRR